MQYQCLCNILHKCALCTGIDSTSIVHLHFLFSPPLSTPDASVSRGRYLFSVERSNSLPYSKYSRHRAESFTTIEKLFQTWVYFCGDEPCCIKARHGDKLPAHHIAILKYGFLCIVYVYSTFPTVCTALHIFGDLLGVYGKKCNPEQKHSACYTLFCGAVLTPVGQYVVQSPTQNGSKGKLKNKLNSFKHL